jgi:hypothetical protein
MWLRLRRVALSDLEILLDLLDLVATASIHLVDSVDGMRLSISELPLQL